MTEKLGTMVRPWIMPAITMIGTGLAAYMSVRVALAEIRGDNKRQDVQIHALEETDRRHDSDIRDIREKM